MAIYKVGELFCGPGGIALGAEIANQTIKKFTKSELSHAWAVDYHKDTIDTYLKNINGATSSSAICEDVRKITLEQLKSISKKIDGFAYGFPCNDFSLVGEQKGIKGDFGPLYSYGLPILNEFNPKFFIAENVAGIKSSNNGNTLIKIIKDLSLSGIGYNVTPHLYKFEEYGIPQCRHRVIIVGIRKDLDLIFNPPAPSVTKFKTCKSAIEIPIIKHDAKNNECTRQSANVIERLKYIKPGENAWNAEIPDKLKLNVMGAKLSQIYKRLDPTKPAYTITGSGGGGTHVYHWSENRALTNRERARLQTFPDNFIFSGSKESVRRQIGMAVPPIAASFLFEAIIKTLEGVKYKSITPNILID
jgi:DNA (cytosine-5)-methyltransferase 1